MYLIKRALLLIPYFKKKLLRNVPVLRNDPELAGIKPLSMSGVFAHKYFCVSYMTNKTGGLAEGWKGWKIEFKLYSLQLILKNDINHTYEVANYVIYFDDYESLLMTTSPRQIENVIKNRLDNVRKQLLD